MKKLNKFIIMPMLALTIASCGNKVDTDSSSSSNSEQSSESLSQWDDPLAIIPEEVLNYQGDIDILTYIEGQNGTIPDIGSSKITSRDLFDSELARFAAAAREFKKIAPGVRINVIYCSIDQYMDNMNAYNSQKGHIPHIMHPVLAFYQMIEGGFITDLSIYQDKEYYQAINPAYMDMINYGGFQAGFPTHYAPYGMFVNKKNLKENYVVDPTNAEEYANWVDNMTYEQFVNVCNEVYKSGAYGAIGGADSTMISIAGHTIYKNLTQNGKVEFTNDEVRSLLELENQIVSKSVYTYPNPNKPGNAPVKEDMPAGIASWWANQNFVDGYYTFYTNSPWNIGIISQLAQEANKGFDDFDFIPFPRANADTEFIENIAVGGLSIGNLCPIDYTGTEKCYAPTAKLETDVAAYFTMFMIADPRAIKAATEVEWTLGTDSDSGLTKGVVSLPIVNKNFRYKWQDDPEIVEQMGGDPAADFADNYDYQLSLYLKTYPTWYDSSVNPEPDVVNFSNVSYGLYKILDTMNNHPENVISMGSIPSVVQEGGVAVNIFSDWNDRYNTYDIGSDTYTSNVIAALSDMQDKINSRYTTTLTYLQESLDSFYGVGKYDVFA